MDRRAWWGVAAFVASSGLAWGQSGGRRAIRPPVVVGVSPPGGRVGTVVEWAIAGRGLEKVKRLLVSGSGVEALDFEAKDDGRAVARVRIASDATPGCRELRVEGADGVSNLVLVRLDTLPQVDEAEPNDEPGRARRVAIGSAVAGVLKATDVDHFRVEGVPGTRLTLDLEARRVGTSISPVLTVLDPGGAAIAQARESRSVDRDCRLAATIPVGGALVVQVRDNVYGGGDSANYRLRVTAAPFATGMFPLGGPRGKPLTITALGGNLRGPLSRTIALPDAPGMVIDPGPFETPDGPVDAPMSIVVGDDREVFEDSGRPRDAPPTPIHIGETVNGRIGRRGEVDRYATSVKKGEKFRLSIQAEGLGSWLDSVVTVRDGAGKSLAENDDSAASPDVPGRRAVNSLGVAEGGVDSRLDFEAPADGPVTIEVTDRYGDGGPEFAYRLSVGAARPDFAVSVLIGNPNANGQVAGAALNRAIMATPGIFGVFNLRPGSKVPVNFLVVPQGRPGPVTVRVEGLPEGVTAEPVTVDVLGPGPKGGHPNLIDAPAKADHFVLEVAPHASPGLGEFRVVATAGPASGASLTRTASATIGLEAIPSDVPARPINRRIERFPLRVVGEERPRFVGPPEEPRLRAVRVPGVLLQGDRLELGLEFDQSPLLDPGFAFEARAEGVGLATNTVIASGDSLPESDDEPPGDVLVRVLASARAAPGVYPVRISYKMTGGRARASELSVIVRPPVEVLTRSETLTIRPGGSVEFWVGLRREVGCREDVDLKVEGLPRGVKLAGPSTLKGVEDEAMLRLEMAPSARPLASPTAVRVVAIARMPRGSVAVEARNRPMIAAPPAER